MFGEIKKQWHKKLCCHARAIRGQIRKEDYPQKLKDLLDIVLKTKNLRSGFESRGIYPFAPQHVIEGTESNTVQRRHLGIQQFLDKTFKAKNLLQNAFQVENMHLFCCIEC